MKGYKQKNPRQLFSEQMCIKCSYWYAPVSLNDSGLCSHCERAKQNRQERSQRDRVEFRLELALMTWERLMAEYADSMGEAETVYFFRGTTTRKVKIGYTASSVLHRLLECQIGSPDPLEVLGVVHAPFAVEQELHALFAAYHSHGEWFDGNSVLYKFIKAVSYIPDLSKQKK